MRRGFLSFLAWSPILAILAMAGCEQRSGDSSAGSSRGGTARPREAAKVPEASKTWKIGAIMPCSGGLAAYGQATLAGVKMKVAELNEKGGVLGKPIELVVENDEGQTNKAAEALRKLAGMNEVLAVVGPITSTNCLAITRDAQKKGVVLITPTGTNDSITKDGDFIFRACFNDSFQGVAMAEFAARDLKLKSAVSFQDTSSDYSVGLCKSFDTRFAELGGKALPILSYKGKDTDFTPQLRQVRELAAEALFIPGYPPELPLIVNQAKSMGLLVQLLGADGWDSDDMPRNAGTNVAGTCFSAAFFPGMHTPELDAFLTLAEKGGIENPGSFEALGYDATGLVAEAIHRAGSTAGDLQARRRAVRDQLHALRDYKGATGSITMQPSGDPIKSLVVLRYESVDGKVKKALAKVVEPLSTTSSLALITPGKGVGELRLGMSKEEALKILGTPDQDDQQGVLKYFAKGIEVFVSQGKVLVIICHSRTPDDQRRGFNNYEQYPGKTDKGVALGASKSEVLAAYGQPSGEQALGSETNLSYRDPFITFTIDSSNRVKTIMVPSIMVK